MSTSKYFDKICCIVLALAILLTILFMNGENLGIKKASRVMGYETKLFDTSKVHTLNIVMNDWVKFIENCESEEYYTCSVTIDNEAYKNIAIRGKGNTSLSQVKSYGNDRYSFKIEFDHYDSTKNYYGLDKLCLNNIIQDNTYMKDYITYQMMAKAGSPAPLCSFVYITVNGEDWGLYLAVEAVEDSFLQRNYGKDAGELYKPDSMNMGGGRGNGEKFDMNDFMNRENGSDSSKSENSKKDNSSKEESSDNSTSTDTSSVITTSNSDVLLTANNGFGGWGDFSGEMPEGAPNGGFGGQAPPDFGGGEMPNFDGQTPPNFDGQTPPDFQNGEMPENFDPSQFFGGQMPENQQGAQTKPTENSKPSEDSSKPEESQENTSSEQTESSENTQSSDSSKDTQTTESETQSKGEISSDKSQDKKPQSSNTNRPNMNFGGMGGMMGKSNDVLLKYIDDNIDSYSNIFSSAKTDINENDKKRLINALKNLSEGKDLENTVDVESLISYFVAHNFVLNFDSYTGSMIHNYYLYEDDGQLSMLPWDYNLAFGGFMSMGSAESLINYPIDSPVSNGNTSDRPMIAWIFENEKYTELYHEYFDKFILEYFESGYFEKMIDDTIALISPYVEKDPTKFCTFEEFQNGSSTLKEFCLLRAESIRGQLNGTIGKTSDTQDSSTFIKADNINLSSMGSMGGMGGFGGNKGGNSSSDKGNRPDKNSSNSSSNPSDDNDKTSSDTSSNSSSDNQGIFSKFPFQNGGDFEFSGATPDAQNGEASSGAQSGGFRGQMPNFENGFSGEKPDGESFKNGFDFGNKGQKPDNSQFSQNSKISKSSIITLGVSILILILGLAFAICFKRRK